MERDKQRLGEDKDLLIQRSNKILTQKGYSKLFSAYTYTRGELKETIKMMDEQPNFSGRDQIVLHFNRTDMRGDRQFSEHIATHKFPNRVAAKAFIEAATREAGERVPTPTVKWISKERLSLNDWIIITSDGPKSLESIMEANTNKFKLPPPYDNYAGVICAYHWGSHPQINTRSRNTPLTEEEYDKYAPPASQRPQKSAKEREQSSKSARQKPQERHTAAKAPKQAAKQPKTGMISLGAICASLKLDAKEARNALRKTSYPKPGASWEWPSDKAEKISKDVKSAVEKVRKK